MSVTFSGSSAGVVLDAAAVARAITRLAHQIRESTPDPSMLALVGVRTRGVPLAGRLQLELERQTGHRAPIGELDITSYRDDLTSRALPQDRSPRLPFHVDGRAIVLVDDVLYTGRTARAALDALIDAGRPGSVRLAVLVDRGHRELPIRPDYVGKNLPSARDEEVQVRLVETDGTDEVLLVRKGERS